MTGRAEGDRRPRLAVIGAEQLIDVDEQRRVRPRTGEWTDRHRATRCHADEPKALRHVY